MTPGCLTSNKSLKIIVVQFPEEMCMHCSFATINLCKRRRKMRREVEINLRPGLRRVVSRHVYTCLAQGQTSSYLQLHFCSFSTPRFAPLASLRKARSMSGPRAIQPVGRSVRRRALRKNTSCFAPPHCRKVPQTRHRLSVWADSIALMLSRSLIPSISAVPFRDHLRADTDVRNGERERKGKKRASWMDLVSIAP